MVVVSPSKSWLSGMRIQSLGRHHQQLQRDDVRTAKSRHKLGILAFEAARTMCRLVSLYRALSDAEVARLRSAMRSRGVAYLNSADWVPLVHLACAEMVDDLDTAAAAVALLARRCATTGGATWLHHSFDQVYANLKAGVGDFSQLGLGLQPKDVEMMVKKMERLVASTTALYVAMEGLAELEAWQQRQAGRWKHCTDASDTLQKRISQQRDRVRQLRQESLWGCHVEKVAKLMARSVVSIFARICSVYGSFISDLPAVVLGRNGRIEFAPRHHSRLCPQQHPRGGGGRGGGGIYSSGPLERLIEHGNVFMRNSGPLLRPVHKETAAENTKSWQERALELPPNTLGASGLALRYAKVVTLVESLARSPQTVAVETRDELYWMLPAGLRGAVRAKLRGHWKADDHGGSGAPTEELAGGWREAADEILRWLGPMAQDTVQWHVERGFEQRQLDTASRVLLVKTLMLSDKEKAEAAIVELLVAVSCVCRYSEGGDSQDSG